MNYIQGSWATLLGKEVVVTQKNKVLVCGVLSKITDDYENKDLQKVHIQTNSESEQIGRVKPTGKQKIATLYAVNIKSITKL
jgi:hypothetical protein